MKKKAFITTRDLHEFKVDKKIALEFICGEDELRQIQDNIFIREFDIIKIIFKR